MSRTITIPVVTRTQDNGDGGYTTYVYNNNDELIKDHPKSTKSVFIGNSRQYVDVHLTQKEIDDILNEDDPYKNGYIGKSTISIEIDENGVAKLAKSCSFHAGQ
jgi:hypothetical protein